MTMTPAGMIYGPTSSGKMYLCSKEHRGANHRKSQWAASVPPVTEYGIFQMADGYNWVDDFGHYWGVLGSDAPKLGSAGEKLAKFPANASEAPAPWHGYPVSPRVRGVEDSPPFSFVEEWWKTGGITRTIARRIQRRKL